MAKKLFTRATLLLSIIMFIVHCSPKNPVQNIEKWDVFELGLAGPTAGNPYMDVEFSAVFTLDGQSIKVPGFYDGNGMYKIRFSPPEEGMWTYKTQSSAPDLSNKTGSFRCIANTGNNNGPLRIVNTFYLEYANGQPIYLTGTTAYQWTSVKQHIQDSTLQTLKKSPFNKVRMCVFPKYFGFGNESEPWEYPFLKEGDQSFHDQPNFIFFQNLDQRIKQLLDLGIQADVILFHPYDTWGYAEMGHEMNERYVRYMIARLSAYRNVWWSLANEWDEPKTKNAIDWEAIGTLLQNEDPHQRFRGIHNWHDTDDHFYDHTRPWITHVSAQTPYFFHSEKYRQMYQKPLLYDEMRYEGGVPHGWGNLTAEQMTSYFWMSGLSGAYGTHGETFVNEIDADTEVRWWAKGGRLVGHSMPRIAFFKSVMEKAPVTEMAPSVQLAGIPDEIEGYVYYFHKPGKYYMAYSAKAGYPVEINLPEDNSFQLTVYDTWNMCVTEEIASVSGHFSYTTKVPYTAIVAKQQ